MPIDLERVKKHLRFIARPRDAFENPVRLKEIQKYIYSEFISYGYEVRTQPVICQGRTFENLLVKRPEVSSFPEFIVAAHFDSAPGGTPGADDNASGTSALLEIARCAKDLPAAVHFIAFNLEEYGMLGSLEYVKSLTSGMSAENRGKFIGMLSLEMIGFTSREKGSQKMPAVLKPFYPDTGDFLALVADGGSSKLLKLAEPAFKKAGLPVHKLQVPMKGNLFPAVRLSDHSPFWDEGFPALLVTDTSFFRNPHYHEAGDTVETLDLDFLCKTAEGCLGLLETLKPL